MHEYLRWLVEYEYGFNRVVAVIIGILMLGMSLMMLSGVRLDMKRPEEHPHRWPRLAAANYFLAGTVVFLILLTLRTPDDPLLVLFGYIAIVFLPGAGLSSSLGMRDLKDRGIAVPSDEERKAMLKEIIAEERKKRAQRRDDRGMQ